ncbi:hypothetical protein KFE98_11275 [bacterium SCSIO 12741]|nr:hypothetical protein KFE98_11275 [bacterium SCSIO 12741]
MPNRSSYWSWKALGLILGLALVFAFIPDGHSVKSKPKKKRKEGRKVQIVHADNLIYNEEGGVRAKQLVGNVQVKHGTTLMSCDSALIYNKPNLMKAYGHVVIEEPDSVKMYGDSLKYYGDRKMAEVRGDVKLIQGDMVLTTNFLNYNRASQIGHYFNGGQIVMNEGKDTLTSEKGYFYQKTDEAHFKSSVRMISKDYEIITDTMQYDMGEEISRFFGPTTITSEDNRIYTERGFSNNKTGVSVFTKNSQIYTSEQELSGDSIIYDQKNDIGEVFGNVMMLDTVNDLMVEGQYALHNQKDSTSLVLGDPLMTQFFEKDSLFLHADTLFSTYDSTREFRLMHAYPQAQFYKSDMQGKCDSLVFSDIDSSIHLYYDPIIWSEENQITAEFIQIFRANGKIDRMAINEQAFIISREDSSLMYPKFNQIKGDSMMGFMIDNELRKVEVYHKGKTIYFAKDEKEAYIGMNRAEAEYLTIYLDSSQVSSILFRENPKATLYPLKDVTPRMQYLKDFKWRGKERPLRREDVYNWKEEEEIKEGDKP